MRNTKNEDLGGPVYLFVRCTHSVGRVVVFHTYRTRDKEHVTQAKQRVVSYVQIS